MTEQIQHVVVVMLENRSYDNVLGWLYHPSNASPYDKAPSGQSTLQGLTGSEENPDPNGGPPIPVHNDQEGQVGGSGQQYPGTAIPLLDPGELFGYMARQFNASAPAKLPYDNYPPPTKDQMQGFTTNYDEILSKTFGASSAETQNNVQDVMNYLTPEQLPVTAWLANHFAVCDEWFASVPSQTYVNRVFALCAAPGIVQTSKGNYSVVNDADFPVDLVNLTPEKAPPAPGLLSLPTIGSQLDLVRGAEQTNWKIYFHDYSIAVMTIPSIDATANVATFDNSDWGNSAPKQGLGQGTTTFYDDVTGANGGVLPAFSFIEPRYSSDFAPNPLPPNSNHPGPSPFGVSKTVDPSRPPIDATGGELLLMQVYNLLRHSSYWPSTLLIITYDEPGGIYDHVLPPTGATPPGTVNIGTPPMAVPNASTSKISLIEDSHDVAVDGFGYNVYGGRVPAILVSPLIAPGTTIRAKEEGKYFDHSSIVKTVWDIFNLSQSPQTVTPLSVTSLTARDAAAPSIKDSLIGSNLAGPFNSAVVASPSFVIMSGTRIGGTKSQTVLVSGGSSASGLTVALTTEVTATLPDGKTWLQVSMAPGTGDVWIATLSIENVHLYTPTKDSPYTGTITFTAGSLSTVVTVTFYLS